MSYSTWRLGLTGEGFLVELEDDDDFELAIYSSAEVETQFHFVLFVTQRHAEGNPARLFGAILVDTTGGFHIKVRPEKQTGLWRLARQVSAKDPRLWWHGPRGIDRG